MAKRGPGRSTRDQELTSAIAEKIRKYRLEKGFTQTQLANHASLPLATIVVFENAERRPSPAELFLLSAALSKPIGAFFS